MALTFDHPAWLFAAALAIPLGIVGLRWFTAMSPVRRWSAVVARAVLLALISAMLAGASTVRRTDRVAVVVVVDVSGSVRRYARVEDAQTGESRPALDAARAYVDHAARRRGPDDLLGVVVFDGRAIAVASPTRAELRDRPLDVEGIDGSDIAGALRYAAAMIPPGAAGRVVLVSDGNETAGDARAAAREIARDPAGPRVRIDVAPLAYAVERETMIEHVDAPPRAPAEATITVRVTIRSTAGSSGTLRLTREGVPVDIDPASPGTGRRLVVGPGRHVELVEVPLDEARVHRFVAVFEPDRAEDGTFAGDTHLENNAGEAFTLTPGRGSILLVAGARLGDETTLSRTLRREGFEVSVVPAGGVPGDLLALQPYDLVILEDVPADAIPASTQQALSRHVRELGAGLVMVGGYDSFGAGGWRGSAIEPLLPVDLNLPETLVRPAAAIALVLDNSGSMNRGVLTSLMTQQEIANEAAVLAIRGLDPTDLVTVITFNNAAEVVVPLAPNTTPTTTAERIRSISPGGGTNLAPALDAAMQQLAGARADVRHALVLSDGRSMGAEALPGMAAELRRAGITVSTIAVGDQADDETMAAIAEQGGGAYYRVSDPTLLPRFFMKAIQIIRTPMIREGTIRAVITPAASPMTAGLDAPPALAGMVLSQARRDPTIVTAMAASTGEPLLAHWTVELGQVVAFTSDADEWARSWVDWPGYRRMWSQVARAASRAPSDDRSVMRASIEDDRLRVRLDAAGDRGEPLDLLTVRATVYTPAGKPVEMTLAQTGPGRYEGETPATESGNYVVVARPRAGAKPLRPVLGGATLAAGAELRALRSNVALLRAIAEETGGRLIDLAQPDAVPPFDRTGLEPARGRTPLWPPLLAWTVVVLMLDIGTRRVAWDRLTSAAFGAQLPGVIRDAASRRDTRTASMLGRIRGVRSSADPPPDTDAIARAEADRHLRAARDAARRRLAKIRETGGAADAAPIDEVRSPSRTDAAEDASPPSLLEAKRRARRRFGEGDTGEDAER